MPQREYESFYQLTCGCGQYKIINGWWMAEAPGDSTTWSVSAFGTRHLGHHLKITRIKEPA